jgi:hypothetical protein
MFQAKNAQANKCESKAIGHSYSKMLFDHVCSLVIVALQFGKTAMFMWMLCEGIHLNNVLTVSVFKNHFKAFYFHILGWRESSIVSAGSLLFVLSCSLVVPLVLTLSWSLVMLVREGNRR